MSKLQEIKQAFIDYDVPAIIDTQYSQEEVDILRMVVDYVPSLISQLEQAQQDIETLKAIEYAQGYWAREGLIERLQAENEQLKADKQKYERELEWYAACEHYEANVKNQWGPEIVILDDGGQRAYDILKEVKGND